MRLDGLEHFNNPPIPEGYVLTTYHEGLEDGWRRIVKNSFSNIRPPDISQITASKSFDPEGFFFLMFQNEVVGSVYARQAKDGDFRFGDVVALCVASQYRGKKLGHFLILRAFEYFKAKGIRTVILDVEKNNRVAINMYTSMGFETISDHPRLRL